MPEADSSICLQPILRNLEAIQVEIGKAQLALLDLLVDSDAKECDVVTRSALIRLESIQRSVGEVQVMLFREVAGGEAALTELDAPLDIAAAPASPAGVFQEPAKWDAPPVLAGKTAATPVPSGASGVTPPVVSPLDER